MKNVRVFFALSSALIVAASVFGVSADARKSDLDQCTAKGLNKAECACEMALQKGSKKALRDFLKLYRNADTACNALASTAKSSDNNSNGGEIGSSSGSSGSSSSSSGGSSSSSSSGSSGSSSGSSGGSSGSSGGSSGSSGGSNNGHGNGDQDAPGNSGDNNNAENSEHSGQGNSGNNGGNGKNH